MAKLHELLAVESNLKGQAEKLRNDLTKTFSDKRHLFEEKRKSYTGFEEGAKPVVEEQLDIQTTVTEEIGWIGKHLAKAIDVGYQVDLANTGAFADVVLEDGETLAEHVPATCLLQLEKRLKEVHSLIGAIPTLDPAKGFMLDTTHRKNGVYVAREVTKQRTKKNHKVITLAAATKEHPAQVDVKEVDEPVGTILEQEWSAMLTPKLKADLLDRVEMLIRAVTKARSRANEQEIDVHGKRIGMALLHYVFEPLKPSFEM